ncbi:urea ABC transporter substrate-binding protein [Succinatimonas hippei]|uniref:urea ABC transporter substrate-binding protein n=1 Tax=Succinatimonas hippei TaxID=626938 RepID=UPI002013926B|nr:urea ABC transporter substrate-binding protein [Succinatimonas hippei]MCL1602943.1 urea ABC transporter substrate-binding protein [Succinatimonas hippei]
MKTKTWLKLSKLAAALGISALISSSALADEVNPKGYAVTDDTVTVGILHSVTGTVALSEAGSVQGERLAIEQINAQGGVLGRKIEVIQEDGASDWPTYAEKAKKLIVDDKVAAIFGCWTSASRKAVLPIVEQYDNLLFYPVFTEGMESSPNIIYMGPDATQQIIAGLDWVINQKKAKSFYFVGSDYIWPRTSFKIARQYIEKKGLKVKGEEYYPLGHTQFNSVINKIKLQKPDVIFSTIVGGSNVAFYKQLKASGIDLLKEKPLLLTTSITEDEVSGIGGENIEGGYSIMKYFQSIPGKSNEEFVKAFKARYGEDAIIGDTTEAAYLGPWIWKAAVEKAGTFDIDKLKEVLPSIELTDTPNGPIKVHENHYLWMKTMIGQAQKNGQFKIVSESKMMEPNPFMKGY